MQSAFNLEFWEKPRNFLPAHVLRFNYGKESSPTKLSLDCYLQLEMPKSTQSAKSNYFEGNIITCYFWCTEGSACGIWRDRSILAVWKSLWFHLLQSPPHRAPLKGKAQTGSLQHPGTPSTFKYFIHTETTILSPSNGWLMQRYLRR